MWTYRTHRLVARPIAAVRVGIEALVRSTWAPHASLVTTEHHGTRTDWIARPADADDLDVALSWTLTDLDGSTYVELALDELEAGADPSDGLEEVLDLLEVLTLPTRTVAG